MREISTEIVIIGGGPAGMAAAVSAAERGAKDIIIVERAPSLSGILGQCIHHGFGLHKFKKELTGPEYSQIYENLVSEKGIKVLSDTMALDIDGEKKIVTCDDKDGKLLIKSKAIILAMGCRERPRGALTIYGTRPAGIYTAGTAQKLINIMGLMPGRKVVILGSGDIGLIMARRMKLEGADVKAVLEIMPDSGGLTRNIQQCLNDFDIPLYLNTTVYEVFGKDRLTGVTAVKVDDNLNPVKGTEQYIECDTLLLSVGLIPENELSKKAGVSINPKTRGPVVDFNRQTSVPGIFACGNVVKVHELVDYVSSEAEIAGTAAADYVLGRDLSKPVLAPCEEKAAVKGVKNLSEEPGSEVVICTVCPMGCRILVKGDQVTGNTCNRGKEFALKEMSTPMRTVTTTMRTASGKIIPVRSDIPVHKEKVAEIVLAVSKIHPILPASKGQILVRSVDGDANIVASHDEQ